MRSQDPEAALAVWGLEVSILDRTYDIAPIAASGWMLALLDPDPLAMLPGLLAEDDQLAVYEQVALGELDLETLENATRDILEAVSGVRWWEADRLIRGAAANWLIFGGELGRNGVDLTRVSLGQALAVIYVMAVRTMKEDERTRFDMDLSSPPAGVGFEEAVDATAQNAFIAALGMPPT